MCVVGWDSDEVELKKVGTSEGEFCISDVGKMLRFTKLRQLFDFMSTIGWIQRSNGGAWVATQFAVEFGFMRRRAHVTARGLEQLARRINGLPDTSAIYKRVLEEFRSQLDRGCATLQ
ncbi:phage antirepressor KilAC domain-containing protein [Neoroseomonas lacus]|uniref:Antirepressor protein C-terminal domain-containing protein n=1 Tax=Neoroseomonas lacus TaxID=287609 RepID=A0A917NJ35_9PROT|nr:phage antirepressor KilAC domain-containing protein [Neoroseomonas lacus]GGJ04652.1 hypothetical protein GCM10011320_09430 [Neoroseomonas lacus]